MKSEQLGEVIALDSNLIHPVVKVIWDRSRIDWTIGFKDKDNNPDSIVPFAVWKFTEGNELKGEILLSIHDIIKSNALSCRWILLQDNLNGRKFWLLPEIFQGLKSLSPENDNKSASNDFFAMTGLDISNLYNDISIISRLLIDSLNY